VGTVEMITDDDDDDDNLTCIFFAKKW